MELELIVNPNYQQLTYLMLLGVALLVVGSALITVPLDDLTEISIIEADFSKQTNYTMLASGVAVVIVGVTLLWAFFASSSLSQYDYAVTYEKIQKEIKTVYGLEVTPEEVAALASDGFQSHHGEETRLEFYGSTTTLNSNSEIINIQLVEINDEYKLVYADGEPTKLEELERLK